MSFSSQASFYYRFIVMPDLRYKDPQFPKVTDDKTAVGDNFPRIKE